MTRQVFYVVKEKDVQVGEPHIFLKSAIVAAKDIFRSHGEAGQAFFDGTVETTTHMEARSAHRVITIDEV